MNRIVATLFAAIAVAVAVAGAGRVFSPLAVAIALALTYRTRFERVSSIPAAPLKGWTAHVATVDAVRESYAGFLASRQPGDKVVLKRSAGGAADSNRTMSPLYKSAPRVTSVDVSSLTGVIALDPAARLLHVEPGVSQDEVARAALARGWIPAVVPEFPGITAGGAFSGGGIESTSHRAGSVADTVAELDIITGDGRYLTRVSRDHHPDLFAAAATGFGTVGVITRLALRLDPAPPYVAVSYLHLASPRAAAAALTSLSDGVAPTAKNARVAPPEFLDGVALSSDSAVVVVGTPADGPMEGAPLLSLRASRTAPWFFWHLANIGRSSPAMDEATFAKAWADVVAARGGSGTVAALALGDYPACVRVDTVPIEDYLFRFDRGAFWMARNGLEIFYGGAAWTEPAAPPAKAAAPGPVPRTPRAPPPPLPPPAPSAGPAAILRVKYAWLATTRQLYRMLHHVGDETVARCYVVQDFVMPCADSAAELIETETAPPSKLGIWPLWMCPVRHIALPGRGGAGYGFPYSTSKPGCVWINVGVYGVPLGGAPFDPLAVNGGLETAVSRLGGRKMLYAQSFYTRTEFDSLFDNDAYSAARSEYATASPASSTDYVFPDAASKLLLGDARRASLSGVVPTSLLAAWRPMVPWYFSLWGELLLPRSLHPSLGIHHTGMAVTAPLSRDAVAAEAATCAAERAALGARFGPVRSPQDSARARGGATPKRSGSGSKLPSPAAVKAAFKEALARTRSGGRLASVE